MSPVVVSLGETGWIIARVLLNPLVTRQLGVGKVLGGVKVAANCVQLVQGGFHVECFGSVLRILLDFVLVKKNHVDHKTSHGARIAS